MNRYEPLARYADGERNFLGANLRGANLREADLSGADLSGADLSGATIEKNQISGIIAAFGLNVV